MQQCTCCTSYSLTMSQWGREDGLRKINLETYTGSTTWPSYNIKYKTFIELRHLGLFNLFVTSNGCNQCMGHQRKLQNLSSSVGTTTWAFLVSFMVTHGGRTDGDLCVWGGYILYLPQSYSSALHWQDDRETNSNTAPFVPVGQFSRHFYTSPPPLPQL